MDHVNTYTDVKTGRTTRVYRLPQRFVDQQIAPVAWRRIHGAPCGTLYVSSDLRQIAHQTGATLVIDSFGSFKRFIAHLARAYGVSITSLITAGHLLGAIGGAS